MHFHPVLPVQRPSGPALPRLWHGSFLALAMLGLAACGGGGGGGGDDGGNTVGDAARRAVLKDIGEEIILPALRDFDAKAGALETAADALAAAPASEAAGDAARAAWEAAMASWQRSEVLQIGPAGRSQNPDMVVGGQDIRDQIYSWPVTLNVCGLETAAQNGAAVAGAAINITGLGAIEYLLFTDTAKTDCPQPYVAPDAAKRAVHVQKLAVQTAGLATNLRNRWEPAGGNFVTQWSTAGAGSVFYMTPQSALNALSVALFYVEKSTKDRKISLTTGIGATGLVCPGTSCPEFLESRLSRHSGANLAANIQAFRDVFTGVNGKLGMNSLLQGIGRSDLSTEITNELSAVLAHLASIESGAGFDAAVEAIADKTECTNAAASSSGLPPCALHGLLKTAMDTFRGSIVAALSLAIPSSAAGDND
jgi:predicted lipoprotein